MKTLATLAVFAALVSVPAEAQKLDLNFNAVAKNATDKTEISLEGPMLEMVKQTVLKNLTTEQMALFGSVQQIGLHNYEFAKSGDYSDSDLASLRKQLTSSPGWSRVLNSKDKNENTEIYVLTEGDKANGVVLISAAAKELTVIHIVGSIQLAKLQELVNSTLQFKDLAQ